MRTIVEHWIECHERSDDARVPLRIQSVYAPDLAKRRLSAEELSRVEHAGVAEVIFEASAFLDGPHCG